MVYKHSSTCFQCLCNENPPVEMLEPYCKSKLQCHWHTYSTRACVLPSNQLQLLQEGSPCPKKDTVRARPWSRSVGVYIQHVFYIWSMPSSSSHTELMLSLSCGSCVGGAESGPPVGQIKNTPSASPYFIWDIAHCFSDRCLVWSRVFFWKWNTLKFKYLATLFHIMKVYRPELEVM